MKTALLSGHKLEENLDCNLQQLVNALLERIAIQGPSAANESRVGYDPGSKQFWGLTDSQAFHFVLSELGLGGLLYPIDLATSNVDGPTTNPASICSSSIMLATCSTPFSSPKQAFETS